MRSDGVRVQGTGSVDVVPDVVFADLGVQARGAELGHTLASAEATLRRMLDSLAAHGVDQVDLRTTQTSVWHEDRTNAEGVLVASVVHVDLGLRATIRELSRAGDLVHAALADGGADARMSSLAFGLADPGAAQRQARDRAFADAAAKAEQFAALAGRSLGDVVSISEGGGPGRPGFADMRQMAMPAGGAMPVEGGQQAVAASVSVCWAWA